MPDPNPSPSPTPRKKAALTTGPQTKLTRSPRLRLGEIEARQDLVLLKTICGLKAQEIAEDLKLKVTTVRADLVAARRSDMLLAARDRVQTLIPKAIAVLETYLEHGDKDVALVVLEGLGVIGRHIQVTMPVSPQPGTVTFEAFRAKFTTAPPASADPAPDLPADPEPVIDGQVVDAHTETPASPPPAPPRLGARRYFGTHTPNAIGGTV